MFPFVNLQLLTKKIENCELTIIRQTKSQWEVTEENKEKDWEEREKNPQWLSG